MFRHVIVGVDGRPNGRDAIALGLQLVDHDGRLTLAHVNSGGTAPQRGANLEFDRTQRAASTELLSHERRAAKIDADLCHTASDTVASGLHRLAHEEGADLLVVGSCHRGRAGRLLVGDDTHAALHGSPCPVAVAPLDYRDAVRPFSEIGVAYDLSPTAHDALAVARAFAVREGASVRALHVLAYVVVPYMSAAPHLWEDMANDDLKLARDALDLPPGVQGDVVMGQTGEQLEAFSESVDLLVVGTRDNGPMRRALSGSTSTRLSEKTKCPLLVVTHPAHLAVRPDRSVEPAAVAG